MIEINAIKRYRVLSEMSQIELARRLGVTQGAVSQWEKGMAFPRGKTLLRLAAILGVPAERLMSYDQQSV